MPQAHFYFLIEPQSLSEGFSLATAAGYSIFWSTVIRNYSLYSIFIAAAFFIIVTLCKSETSIPKKAALWFTLLMSLFLGLMTNYLTLFFMPALFLSALALKKQARFLTLLAAVNIIALILFWLFWGRYLGEHLAYKENAIENIKLAKNARALRPTMSACIFISSGESLFSFNPTKS